VNPILALRRSGIVKPGPFVRTQKSMSPSQALGTTISPGRPKYDYDFDPTRAILKGYKLNAFVFACIHRIASAASSVPWGVFELDAKKWSQVDGHELEVLIEYPNSKMSRKHLMYYVTCWLLATGNGMMKIVREDPFGKKIPSELWPVAARNIGVIPDEEAWISGYEVTENGQKKQWAFDDVVHAMFPDPDDPLWGCGPLEAAWDTVASDTAASRWRRDAYERGGVPPGGISDKTIKTPKQFTDAKERMRAGWREAASGTVPLLLAGDTSWVNFGVSAADLQDLDGRQFNVYTIATAFGLLPAEFDPSAATYDNLDASIRWKYNGPVANALDTIEEALNLRLIPAERRRDTWIHYDFSTVKVLQGELRAKIAGVLDAIRAGVSPDDALEMFDVAGESTPAGRRRFLDAGLVPLDDVGIGGENAEAGSTPAGVGTSNLAVDPGTVGALADDGEAALRGSALNGAQIASVLEIVRSVVEGAIPRDSAVGMLSQLFGLTTSAAEQILGSAGKSGQPKPMKLLPDDGDDVAAT
jgi:HK97 family phage portal protein